MRAAITGIGLLSPVGTSPEGLWQNLLTCGEELSEIPERAMIPQVLSAGATRRMDRLGVMSVTVASLALQHSHILEAKPNMERFGSVLTTICGALASNMQFLTQLLTQGPDLTSPTVFSNTVSNACLGHMTVYHRLKGPSTMFMGSSTVGYGLDLIRGNRADALVAGGLDEFHAVMETAYRKKGLTDTAKHDRFICRPLDKNRNGIGLREGAAAVIMEEYEHATKRGASLLAEVVGYGAAFSPVSPERAKEPISPSPFAEAMKAALTDAEVDAADVSAVVMAAGGSRFGDLAEAEGIREVFGARAASLPVTTPKGLVGETLGGASIIGVATGALAIAEQALPPVAGYETPDEEVGLNVVSERPLRGSFRYVMVNGFDVGGNVSSILLAAASQTR